MAKVTPFPPGQGITPRSKGDFLLLATKHGWVAQKWPKKRGPPKTPYGKWRAKEFAYAAAMASNPFDLDYGTAVEMVKGTTYVPRDFLMMCAYGNAYVITNPDGTEWQRYTEVTNNPQYMLEQLTSTPGSLIYRGTDLWTWLGPGSNGFVLTMVDGEPKWEVPGGAASVGAKVTTLRRITDQAATATGTQTVTWEEAVIDELEIWDPAHPTRLIMPTDVGRIRISFQMRGPTQSVTGHWNMRTQSNLGNADFFGSVQQCAYTPNTASFDHDFLGIGPWAPPPAIDYCELQLTVAPVRNYQFKAGTSITIEATEA